MNVEGYCEFTKIVNKIQHVQKENKNCIYTVTRLQDNQCMLRKGTFLLENCKVNPSKPVSALRFATETEKITF